MPYISGCLRRLPGRDARRAHQANSPAAHADALRRLAASLLPSLPCEERGGRVPREEDQQRFGVMASIILLLRRLQLEDAPRPHRPVALAECHSAAHLGAHLGAPHTPAVCLLEGPLRGSAPLPRPSPDFFCIERRFRPPGLSIVRPRRPPLVLTPSHLRGVGAKTERRVPTRTPIRRRHRAFFISRGLSTLTSSPYTGR